MKKFFWLLMFGAIAVSSVSTSAQTQSEPNTNESDAVGLQSMTCRDLLKLDGEERGNTMIFMHGYMSGKKGQMTIDAQELAEATDNIINSCIDNPSQQVLSVFEQYR